MSDQEQCAKEIDKLKAILGEKKQKLQRDLAFEKRFQTQYGLNERAPVDEIENEIKAVEKLEADVCTGAWCKKGEVVIPEPAPTPTPAPAEEPKQG